ncbi:MAG: hypothetical protein ABFS35_23415 [Bacteroidota bacterium]
MKKRKIELLVTVIISVLIWAYFFTFSVPLRKIDTILVVGCVFIIVYLVGLLIRKIFNKNEKK